MKCANPVCNTDVDALHMDDDGYCNECHDKILDDMAIAESEETKYLSDESLEIILWGMNHHPIRAIGRKGRK